MEGFLLGLSNGTTCLAHCAPVMVPYFLAERKSALRVIVSLSGFLSGRLIGYLVFAVIAWILGNAIAAYPFFRSLLFGIIFLLLSISMAYLGFSGAKDRCALKSMPGAIHRSSTRNPWMITILLGMLTGMNFCPPFLLAFSSTAYDGGLGNCLWFFFTFYLGTAIYFFPMGKEPFQKGRDSKGFGIGLAIVERLCSRFDFQLDISCETNSNTTVRLARRS